MILMGTTNSGNYFKTPLYTLPSTSEVTILLGGRIEGHTTGDDQGLIAWNGGVDVEAVISTSGNLVVTPPSGVPGVAAGVASTTIGTPNEFILGLHINRSNVSTGYITWAMPGRTIYKSGNRNLGSPTSLVDLTIGDVVALDKPLRLGGGINFLSIVAGAFTSDQIQEVVDGKLQLETAPNVVSTFHFIKSTQPVFVDVNMNTIQSVGSSWGDDFDPVIKASPSPVNSTMSYLTRALRKCLSSANHFNQGDARNKDKPGPYAASDINKLVNDVEAASASLTGVFL